MSGWTSKAGPSVLSDRDKALAEINRKQGYCCPFYASETGCRNVYRACEFKHDKSKPIYKLATTSHDHRTDQLLALTEQVAQLTQLVESLSKKN